MTALTDFTTAAGVFLTAAATYAADGTAVAKVTTGGFDFRFDIVGDTFERVTDTRTTLDAAIADLVTDVAEYQALAGTNEDFLEIGDFTVRIAGSELYQIQHV